MKQRPLYCALALILGVTMAAPVCAAQTKMSRDQQIKALHALINKQQQQIDQQQQELQTMREDLRHLEGQQTQTQQQLAEQAKAPPAPATEKPAFTSAPGVSVALHGFVSASAFTQNKPFAFGNGQDAEWPEPGSHGRTSGVDIRNTRFWLDFTGAKLNDDWTGGGRIEMDFFGGFNGSGPYSQQQPLPRLRQAYMTLSNASTGTTVRIGQQWELMFPLDAVPASPTHIGFPLGFATGMIGWRFPGIVLEQDLNHGSGGAQWRLDLGAFTGSWNGPGNNLDYLTAGNVDFHPQMQARLHVKTGDFAGYLAATYSKEDLKGVGGTAPTPVKNSVTSDGVEIGGKWTPGDWLLMGSVYTGKGMGQIFGNLVQFGDIKDTGGYVQAGYHFTPNWSANAFYGYSKSKRSDVIAWLGNGASGRYKNRQSALNLIYSSGAYEFGAEFLHDTLDTTDGMTNTATSGNQFSLSALYHF